ncbi:MAG: hypothetical protein LUD68_03485 [Rikenellaceae bacterium]|nr:hypothetical protein [Rikenellaceae bacterium]
MPKLLISPGEVLELAFSSTDQIDPAAITDTRIETAQLKFLAPALPSLYPALTEKKYADFCREYIKPALAYFIRYQWFTLSSARIGSSGIFQPRPPDTSPADSSTIARIRQESRKTAGLFLRKALVYISDHIE